jgi:hypothetical protein
MMNRNMEIRDKEIREKSKSASYNTELLVQYLKMEGLLPLYNWGKNRETSEEKSQP